MAPGYRDRLSLLTLALLASTAIAGACASSTHAPRDYSVGSPQEDREIKSDASQSDAGDHDASVIEDAAPRIDAATTSTTVASPWPPPPPIVPPIGDTQRAAPSWWRTKPGANLVPGTTSAETLFANATRATGAADDTAGLACKLEGPKRDHLSTRIDILGEDTAFVTTSGNVVFVPGARKERIRQITATLAGRNQIGLLEVFVGAATLAGLLILDDMQQNHSLGKASGNLAGAAPWQFRANALSVTCVPVSRSIVEAQLQKELASVSQCLDAVDAPMSLWESRPEFGCIRDAVALVGWADPRAQAIVAKWDKRREEVREARRKLHAAMLAKTSPRTMGDLEVTTAALKCEHGAHPPRCNIRIDVTNRTPVRLDGPKLPWLGARKLVDAAGRLFDMELTNPNQRKPASESWIAPGASTTYTGTLLAHDPDHAPEPPLLVALPEPPRHEPLEEGRDYSFNGGATLFRAGRLRCKPSSSGWDVVLETQSRSSTHYLHEIELVAVPSGHGTSLLIKDDNNPPAVQYEGWVTRWGERDRNARCPKTWSFRIPAKRPSEDQLLRVD
jgi:hypothetical protein